MYRFGGMPGPTDAKQWSTLLRLLREQQPRNQQAHKQQQGDQPEEVQQQQTAAADDTTAAAISSVGPIHGVAKQLDGQFRNVLLLHVAGRYNDHSIKVCHSSPYDSVCNVRMARCLPAYPLPSASCCHAVLASSFSVVAAAYESSSLSGDQPGSCNPSMLHTGSCIILQCCINCLCQGSKCNYR